jgi:hypothetical protein
MLINLVCVGFTVVVLGSAYIWNAWDQKRMDKRAADHRQAMEEEDRRHEARQALLLQRAKRTPIAQQIRHTKFDNSFGPMVDLIVD